MEGHAVTERLGETRARIRSILVPDPETGRIESQSFPRSAVMRLAFDPRARRMAMAGVSLVLMFANRRRAAKMSLLPVLVRSITALAGMARRR